MNKKVLILFVLIFMSFCFQSIGQQDPLYTQYAFNQVVLNPAVAGTNQGTSFTTMSRLQWSGFPGAPKTHIFSAHTPLKTGNMGLGLTFFHDRIGISRQNEFSALYSYQIKFNSSTLSFGARLVLGSYRANYSEVDLGGIIDPNFERNDFNDFGANFGTGVYYYSDKFYIGFSIPHLTTNKFEVDNNDATFIRRRIYYLLGGYVFDLNKDLKLKPYVNIRVPAGSPVQMDLNASVIYKDRVYIGLGVRPNNSVSVMLEWQIKNFRFGYASDFIQNQSNAFGGGGNELLLNYIIPSKGIKKMKPRYF